MHIRTTALAAMIAGLVLTLAVTGTVAGNKARAPAPVAVVVVLDRSGSMTGPRIDAARAAAKAARAALPAGSEIAVVAFDSRAKVIVTLRDAADQPTIDKAVDGIQAGGGTDLLTGLDLAHAILTHTKLATKHVILLSDGQSPYDGVETEADAMHTDGITITTVAIGDADRNLLSTIANLGGGRMYATEDAAALPKIFTKEIEQITAP